MSGCEAALCMIAGAGDVGGRLARLRAAAGDEVIALRRRQVGPSEGVRALCVDLVSGQGMANMPRTVQTLVFCAAPDERSEAAYRALYFDGLRRLLDHVTCERLLFVSSTAVYSEDAGQWVDESTPVDPPRFNGKILLECERELAGHAGAVVLRCSGIYGPGRDAMLRKAHAVEAGRRHWSNRIHVEDVAAAMSHLLEMSAPQRLYLASDNEPVQEGELLDWLRDRVGVPGCGLLPGNDSGRRISNQRLRDSGWLPRYPDYRSGYGALLDEHRESMGLLFEPKA